MSDDLKEMIMPLMGEGIIEATLIKWLKNPGDRINQDEPLLEVSTDKVDTEIPAPASGFLLGTFAKAGDIVPVNTIIAYISKNPDAKFTAPTKTASAKKAVTATTTAGAHSSSYATSEPEIAHTGSIKSSPLVRKIARDMNINLAGVAGRGLQGRITKKDIFNFIDKVRLDARGTSGDMDAERLKTTHVHGQEFLDGVAIRREKMSKMRVLTAEHMVRSVRTSPHATTVFEVDLHKVVAWREKNKDSFKNKENFSLTYTHVITYAAMQAIKEHRLINCSVDGEDILHKEDINIGLAVAIETGLIVPVIKHSQDMALFQLARAANDLVVRARSKKLSPDDVQGGTFSITNPGGFGSVLANPIINQPQVAILCIGAVVQRPVVVNKEITVRPITNLSLTFDHRVIDGEGATKYLATLKNLLENFDGPTA
jgi:pyruvate dehydrogenase E2 component (dihydrolipoamide acetyltransferase)